LAIENDEEIYMKLTRETLPRVSTKRGIFAWQAQYCYESPEDHCREEEQPEDHGRNAEASSRMYDEGAERIATPRSR
jgi:hypothetical protein